MRIRICSIDIKQTGTVLTVKWAAKVTGFDHEEGFCISAFFDCHVKKISEKARGLILRKGLVLEKNV